VLRQPTRRRGGYEVGCRLDPNQHQVVSAHRADQRGGDGPRRQPLDDASQRVLDRCAHVRIEPVEHDLGRQLQRVRDRELRLACH